MRKSIVIPIITLLFVCLSGQSVLAADFDVVGKLILSDVKSPGLVMDGLSVRGYVVGQPDTFYGDLNFEDDLQFQMGVEELKANDQLIITGEGQKDKSAYFGSATTVITEKELTSGLIGNILIELHELPIPAYETSNENLIKVCWRGLDDFSVVGYEVYRSEFVNEGWESVGRSGQNASKQVCFVDNEAEEDVKYFYKIGALTSWNAGEGSEVLVSEVTSSASDGMMIGLGVVENINEVQVTSENGLDLTVPVVVGSTEYSESFGRLDSVLDRINEFIDERGWSHEIFMIVLLSGILLLVVIFFVASVSLANVRSQGSNLWDKK